MSDRQHAPLQRHGLRRGSSSRQETPRFHVPPTPPWPLHPTHENLSISRHSKTHSSPSTQHAPCTNGQPRCCAANLSHVRPGHVKSPTLRQSASSLSSQPPASRQHAPAIQISMIQGPPAGFEDMYLPSSRSSSGGSVCGSRPSDTDPRHIPLGKFGNNLGGPSIPSSRAYTNLGKPQATPRT